MECSKITAGLIGASCDGISNGGTLYKAWVFNYDDVDRADTMGDKITKIEHLFLKQNKTGYIVTSFDNASEGAVTLNVGTYIKTYDHQVTLRIFAEDEGTLAWLENARGARVVIILQKNGKNEVYGWDSGLVLSENPYNTRYTDNVAYAPVFKTDADSKELHLPLIGPSLESELDALCQALPGGRARAMAEGGEDTDAENENENNEQTNEE